MSAPTAVRFATYKGDVTEVIGKQLMGPNDFGEKFTPVSGLYDPETNTTRLGFALGDHRTKDAEVTL